MKKISFDSGLDTKTIKILQFLGGFALPTSKDSRPGVAEKVFLIASNSTSKALRKIERKCDT